MPTTDTTPTTTPARWGWSARHDRALDECIANHGGCSFGCAKNGAPNCTWHVSLNECVPAQVTT